MFVFHPSGQSHTHHTLLVKVRVSKYTFPRAASSTGRQSRACVRKEVRDPQRLQRSNLLLSLLRR